VLQLPEALNQSTATACLRGLTVAMRGDTTPAVVVDASRLSQFDSAALAVLLALRREAIQLGKTFEMANLPQRLADLADLYGIAELLPAQG
jgi:phospholipid transport system transporter-binding protein